MERRDLTYEVEPLADERLQEVVSLLEQAYVNGGVLLRLLYPTDEAAYDSAWWVNSGARERGLWTFLANRSVREAVHELEIPLPLGVLPEFNCYSGYEFEGAITRLLLIGGAYTGSSLSEDSARAMSRAFVDALVGEHRGTAIVYHLKDAWTPWFYDIAWDSTFLVNVPPLRRVAVFCTTDTD